MRDKIKLTFLGTAANGGVPQLDCRCINCLSKPKRKRSCILIETKKRKLIIDSGPDFHSQLTENNIRLQDISGIVLSHLHWDHCLGIVELTSGKILNLPVLVHNKLKSKLLKNNFFKFIFEKSWARLANEIDGFNIDFIEIEHDPNFPTFAIKVTSDKQVLIATDIFRMNKRFIVEAKHSDLLIFDSTFLNESNHWHIAVKKSAPILSKICKRVIFTHINHSENPEKVINFLDKFNFNLAFDGMVVKI